MFMGIVPYLLDKDGYVSEVSKVIDAIFRKPIE